MSATNDTWIENDQRCGVFLWDRLELEWQQELSKGAILAEVFQVSLRRGRRRDSHSMAMIE